MDKAILEGSLIVEPHLVPLEILKLFQRTLVNKKEQTEINLDFFRYDQNTDRYYFARGNLGLIRSVFKHVEIEDRRSCVTMTQYGRIKFTGTLRDNQKKVADFLIHNSDGWGQLEAPPRFGKTITLVYVCVTLGYKSLFLSHQIDLSKQMLNSFYNFTNILDVEYELGKPIMGIIDNWSDLDKYDICIMPYQKWVTGNNASEMLVKYRNSFGAVYLDESHKCAAPRYSEVVSNFNSRYRIGVTGTISRKDDAHIINEFTIGPPVIKGEGNQIACQVRMVETKINVPIKYQGNKMFFTQMLSYLASHVERNAFCLQFLSAYAKVGHFIMAVTDRKDQILYMVKELKNLGYKAEPYYNGAFKTKQHREDCLNRIRKGDTQIIIAMRSMTLGLDIPRLTAFFNLLPTANGPSYYQETSRIRTPFPDKEVVHVVDFIDSHFIAEGCAKTRRKVYAQHNMDIVA